MENLQRPEHIFVGNAGYGTPRSVSCPRGTAVTCPDWTPRAARFCPVDTSGWISLFLSFFSYGAGDLLFLFLLMIPWVSNPNFPVLIILSFPHPFRSRPWWLLTTPHKKDRERRLGDRRPRLRFHLLPRSPALLKEERKNLSGSME